MFLSRVETGHRSVVITMTGITIFCPKNMRYFFLKSRIGHAFWLKEQYLPITYFISFEGTSSVLIFLFFPKQQLRTAANEGNEEITSRAARDTANALRDYAAAVRGVAATSRDKDSQNRLIEQAHLVMNKSATLVLEAQRAMANPADPNKSSKLSAASNDVLTALGYAMDVMPGQEGVNVCITQIDELTKSIGSGQYLSSGKPYGELQNQLTNAADILNEATSDVVQSAPR